MVTPSSPEDPSNELMKHNVDKINAAANLGFSYKDLTVDSKGKLTLATGLNKIVRWFRSVFSRSGSQDEKIKLLMDSIVQSVEKNADRTIILQRKVDPRDPNSEMKPYYIESYTIAEWVKHINERGQPRETEFFTSKLEVGPTSIAKEKPFKPSVLENNQDIIIKVYDNPDLLPRLTVNGERKLKIEKTAQKTQDRLNIVKAIRKTAKESRDEKITSLKKALGNEAIANQSIQQLAVEINTLLLPPSDL